MIKNIRRFILTSTIIYIGIFNNIIPVLANDYDLDYYEDEGRLLFKLRAFGIKSSASQTKLPQPTNPSPTKVEPLTNNGYGGETSTTIFFNDKIATELSLGVSLLRVNKTSLDNIATNYLGVVATGKGKSLLSFPLTFTAQFHIAPFGAVRPYVGVGYHVAFTYTKIKDFKFHNGHGAVLQGGIDFVAKDNTLINFDIKQYFLTTKLVYNGPITARKEVISKLKINPLDIAVGIGFMF